MGRCLINAGCGYTVTPVHSQEATCGCCSCPAWASVGSVSLSLHFLLPHGGDSGSQTSACKGHQIATAVSPK